MDETTPGAMPGAGAFDAPAAPPAVEVTLPGETPPADPPDPDAAYQDVDYEALLAEFPEVSMSVEDLREVFPLAHRTVQRLGLQAGLELDGLGNHPDLLRGLAQYGRDIRMWEDAAASYRAALPPDTRTRGTPLAGAALQSAVDELLQTYLPDPGIRALVTHTPGLRPSLERMAQERHWYTHLTPALLRATEQHQARQTQQRDAARLTQLRTTLAGMSEQEFDAAYSAAYSRWRQADVEGRLAEAQVAKGELERLARARWGG